ncbi:glutamate--cysteine ligase [Arthrobacter mobilis]|uniref:Putative glutamate--cysteine ligase 2 n=1 Tax=Arthrobacter mobilis TaxID=2724944 RepID=A0A7X6HBM5_9MICC|nr:glutamate--cysteine ligase [Arthrobacter mobilis]NKX54118.1 glutamate--cysteine ligase [Arthrobacter mobilis]
MDGFTEAAAGHPQWNNRTFGVEEEFLLVDERTARPVAVAESSLARTGAGGNSAGCTLTLELKQEQLEAVSPVCSTLDELVAAVSGGRARADEAARAAGARAVALGTSVGRHATHTVPSPRYLDMAQRFGLTLKEQLTCGLHIHVGVASPEEGVAVLDRIRIWLPVLLALSANSPFWQGKDSGYESFRYQAWNRWPSAGPCEVFGSAAAYRAHIESMLAAGVLLDEGMVYFDARLSQNHPTVEVRIGDVCLEASDTAALAAVVRALVETAARQWRAGLPVPKASAAQLRLAGWQASRSGVEGQLVHPLLLTPCTAAEAVEALLKHIRPVLLDSGDEEQVRLGLARVLSRGTGSRRQREVMMATGSRKAVVLDAIEHTHSVPVQPAAAPPLRPAAPAILPG